MEVRAGGDLSVLLSHVPHVGDGGAHPVVQVCEVLGQAGLASPEVWQHLLAEVPQHARLLGVHDGREVQSVQSKIWTSPTAIKHRQRSQSLCHIPAAETDRKLQFINVCLTVLQYQSELAGKFSDRLNYFSFGHKLMTVFRKFT